ncbi:unnamed protein product [Paramecium pentaurelia]|uniref:Uncharacterized protein n=1 Tax=Paramecium pentaurelia TaxID=43138 RepID=A0A8S1TB67_9CILI|nr:unnamed protein product [Paramecium pentaurelia]
MSKVSVSSTYTIGESISSLDISQEYTAAGLLDETVALWKDKVSKENEPQRLEGHFLGIVDIKFSNNGELLAVSSLDSVIRIWDLKKSIKSKEIACDQMENWNICWLKDYLCTAGEGGRLSMFSMDQNQEEIPVFSVENSFGSAITANNANIAVGTDSGSLHIVEDPIEKRKLHSKKIHKKMVRSVKFSNDGFKAFTSSDDGDIKLIDLTKMKEIKTFQHHYSVNSIDVNPIDDKLVVSCSSDYKVRLWDTSSGQCIEQFSPFDKKDDKLWAVRFNRDGSLIGVCSQQGQLSFYSRN